MVLFKINKDFFFFFAWSECFSSSLSDMLLLWWLFFSPMQPESETAEKTEKAL